MAKKMEKYIPKYETCVDLISVDDVSEYYCSPSLEVENEHDQIVKLVVSRMLLEETEFLISKTRDLLNLAVAPVIVTNLLAYAVSYYTEQLANSPSEIESLDLKLVYIESAEIPKGPQGTLYGQGCLGGQVASVNTNPQPPFFDLYNQDDINPLVFFLILYAYFLRWIDLSRTAFISNYLVTVLSAPQQKIYHLRI